MMIKKILPVLIAMLMLLSTAAGASAAANTTNTNNTTNATNSNSYNISQISKSAGTVKSYVETNCSIPSNVKVGNSTVTPAQFLYLLTTATTNVNSGNKSSIKLRNVSTAPNPSENLTSGNLTKSQYLAIASQINTFITANGRLPNYVSTPLGKMEYQSLIYMYSKIMNFYNTNNRLPTTVSVQPWYMNTYGPFATINGTAKFNETLLGSQSYGYVLKLGPFGNSTSKNKVAVVIDVYPQETQSGIAFLNAIEYLSSSLKNMQIWVYDVVVYNGTDYTQGRAWGNALALKYVVPNIDSSYKLLIDVHGNRGFYTNAAGQPIPEIVMAPNSNTNSAWGPTTPASVYQQSLSYANKLINSSYTGGTLHYYYIYSATSPPYVTLPVEAKGIPSLIMDFQLDIANYAQVLYSHDLGILKALNAIFA